MQMNKSEISIFVSNEKSQIFCTKSWQVRLIGHGITKSMPQGHVTVDISWLQLFTVFSPGETILGKQKLIAAHINYSH
jgi:hypothetical protein